MKPKLIVLSLITLSLAAAGVVMTATTAHPKSPRQQIAELEEKGKSIGLTLKERAQLAKLKGERKLFVRQSYGTIFNVEFQDMQTTAAVYSVVIAEPVAATSLLSKDGFIVSLYKFKTLELVSEPPPSKFPFTFSGTPPAELLPFSEGEFQVTLRGGTVDLDGVEVTTRYDDYEPFSMPGKYLLFLEFDTTRRVGGMGMGPLSALSIGEDGTLTTLDKKPHKIKQDIDRNFGNSIAQLKTHLKRLRKS